MTNEMTEKGMTNKFGGTRGLGKEEEGGGGETTTAHHVLAVGVVIVVKKSRDVDQLSQVSVSEVHALYSRHHFISLHCTKRARNIPKSRL